MVLATWPLLLDVADNSGCSLRSDQAERVACRGRDNRSAPTDGHRRIGCNINCTCQRRSARTAIRARAVFKLNRARRTNRSRELTHIDLLTSAKRHLLRQRSNTANRNACSTGRRILAGITHARHVGEHVGLYRAETHADVARSGVRGRARVRGNVVITRRHRGRDRQLLNAVARSEADSGDGAGGSSGVVLFISQRNSAAAGRARDARAGDADIARTAEGGQADYATGGRGRSKLRSEQTDAGLSCVGLRNHDGGQRSKRKQDAEKLLHLLNSPSAPGTRSRSLFWLIESLLLDGGLHPFTKTSR